MSTRGSIRNIQAYQNNHNLRRQTSLLEAQNAAMGIAPLPKYAEQEKRIRKLAIGIVLGLIALIVCLVFPILIPILLIGIVVWVVYRRRNRAPQMQDATTEPIRLPVSRRRHAA